MMKYLKTSRLNRYHTFYELLNEVWNDDYKELQVKKEALDIMVPIKWTSGSDRVAGKRRRR